jgi:hypothetical protein
VEAVVEAVAEVAVEAVVEVAAVHQQQLPHLNSLSQ